MKNFFFGTLALTLLVGLVGLVGCDGSGEENVVGSDAGSVVQPGTCPVPGVGQTSTPARPGNLGYLVATGPVSCAAAYPDWSIAQQKVPCSDLVGNLLTPANPTDAAGFPLYGPCCVVVKVVGTLATPVFPGVKCGDPMSDTPGWGTKQYALCSSSGSFLGWACDQIPIS